MARGNEQQSDVLRLTFDQYRSQTTDMHNFVISGGNSDDRNRALYSMIRWAKTLGLPVIVLHTSNPCLSERHLSPLWGQPVSIYDPLLNKDSDAIADLLADVGRNVLELEPGIAVLIRLVADILLEESAELTLSRFLAFPLHKIMPELARMEEEEIIDAEQRKEYVRRLQGKADVHVDGLARLVSRLRNAWRLYMDTPHPVTGIEQAISGNGVISVDLVTDTNSIMKELCFADIDLAMQRGAHFVLVSDGLSFSSVERSHTDAVLLHNHGNISLIYSAADVPQMVLHKDEVFNTLVGGQVNLILFRHINANSAKKWSDFFGQEWVQFIETSEGLSRQNTKFFEKTHSTNTSTRTERADRFPPETFTEMPAGQGKAYLMDSDGLIHNLARLTLPQLAGGYGV